jgi:hypothetical protein
VLVASVHVSQGHEHPQQGKRPRIHG